MTVIDNLAARILRDSYGGPSLSYENGQFVVYSWGDAPVSINVMGTGSSVYEALKNVPKEVYPEPIES